MQEFRDADITEYYCLITNETQNKIQTIKLYFEDQQFATGG
jgi:hypothetical protein